MIGTLQEILERTGQMLYGQATLLAPALLAALVNNDGGVGVGVAVRWCLLRVYHASRLEKFFVDSGLRPMFGADAGRADGGHGAVHGIPAGRLPDGDQRLRYPAGRGDRGRDGVSAAKLLAVGGDCDRGPVAGAVFRAQRIGVGEQRAVAGPRRWAAARAWR